MHKIVSLIQKFLKLFRLLKRDGFKLTLITVLKFFLKTFDRQGVPAAFLNEKTDRLRTQCHGLHQVLGEKDHTFSVLLLVDDFMGEHLTDCLKSYLDLSAPYLEIVIGLNGVANTQILEQVQEFAEKNSKKIKILKFDKMLVSSLLNHLVEKSTGRFLFFAKANSLVRPDLLWRFEQTLKALKKNPDQVVLYTNECEVDASGKTISGSFWRKISSPHFPYFFCNTLGQSLLVPRKIFDAAKGFRREFDEAYWYDFVLRLNLQNAVFQNIPFFLYAEFKQNRSESLATSSAQTQAFQDYLRLKGIFWKVQQESNSKTCVALPERAKNKDVNAIVLYKDKQELTEKAVKSLEAQRDANVKITLLDNNSFDKSIASQFRSRGLDVIENNESFNFSRLNNIAVRSSKFQDCPYLLIMNNDVELDAHAVSEMLRWIEQPHIGVVGCRLVYPNGELQHGGVELEFWGINNMKEQSWQYIPSSDARSSSLGVVDTVTAACFLVKREIYEKLGGFDEVLHPIAFSDTDFCYRAYRSLGLYSFYTPFATGVHWESATRGKDNIEEYEGSIWLQKILDGSPVDLGIY